MKSKFQKMLAKVIDSNRGQLKKVPNHILFLTLFLSINVLAQGIADIALKLLSYSSILTPLPWRTDYLFLTAVSVLMGYRSLTGMQQQKFDVTRNSLELGLLVEIGLVIGDVIFMKQNRLGIPEVVSMRLPFVVFTSINILIIIYSYYVLRKIKWLPKH